MSATITWKVTQLDCYPLAQGQTTVVFTVHWECVGVDTQNDVLYTGRVYSTCGVQYVEGEPYTPYTQLTESQVLDWIWNAGVSKESTETAVLQQIEMQKTPPTTSPVLPWASTETN